MVPKSIENEVPGHSRRRFRAKTTNKYEKDGLGFVEVETGMTNQDGINTCPGNGTIVLPIKGGKEIPYPFVAPEE